jgi:hypothetical protein
VHATATLRPASSYRVGESADYAQARPGTRFWAAVVESGLEENGRTREQGRYRHLRYDGIRSCCERNRQKSRKPRLAPSSGEVPRQLLSLYA